MTKAILTDESDQLSSIRRIKAKHSRRFSVRILAEMEVDVEYERGQNDETIEKRDPRSCVGDRTEGVNCEEDIEGEDAQECEIDTVQDRNCQFVEAKREVQ